MLQKSAAKSTYSGWPTADPHRTLPSDDRYTSSPTKRHCSSLTLCSWQSSQTLTDSSQVSHRDRQTDRHTDALNYSYVKNLTPVPTCTCLYLKPSVSLSYEHPTYAISSDCITQRSVLLLTNTCAWNQLRAEHCTIAETECLSLTLALWNKANYELWHITVCSTQVNLS
jgi:hypothetical protein